MCGGVLGRVVGENFSLIPSDKEKNPIHIICFESIPLLYQGQFCLCFCFCFGKCLYGMQILLESSWPELRVLISGWLAISPGAWNYKCSMPQWLHLYNEVKNTYLSRNCGTKHPNIFKCD